MRFGDIVRQKGWVSEEQVQSCLELQQWLASEGIIKSIGAIMHDKGLLTMVQIAEALSLLDASRTKAKGGTEAPARAEPKEEKADEGPIPGYRVERVLGKGAMGIVYLGENRETGEKAAIKILAPELSTDAEYVARFLREAESLTQISHPNIVKILDMGEEKGNYFFAMTYIEGESLRERLRRGPLPVGEALAVTVQMASAIDHFYDLRFIHRDIKPGNILIEKKTQKPYLTDLGLTKSLDSKGLTQSGMVVGSPYYLSPEQATAQELDIRADIYSLGVTFYHMLTGHPPFRGSTPLEILQNVTDRNFPDIQKVLPDLSGDVVYIIRKMMAKNRHQRYQKPAACLHDLREYVQTGKVEGKETPGFISRIWQLFGGV